MASLRLLAAWAVGGAEVHLQLPLGRLGRLAIWPPLEKTADPEADSPDASTASCPATGGRPEFRIEGLATGMGKPGRLRRQWMGSLVRFECKKVKPRQQQEGKIRKSEEHHEMKSSVRFGMQK